MKPATSCLAALLLSATTCLGADRDWLTDSSGFTARVAVSPDGSEISLENGLVRRTFRLTPNGATVAFDNLMTGESILRGVKPEAIVAIDGTRLEVGGLTGQPNFAYLAPHWLSEITARETALRFVGHEVGRASARFEWRRVRHHAPDIQWPPPGIHLRMDYALPSSTVPGAAPNPSVAVTVHYELYDGIPLLCKWLTIHNHGEQSVTLESFTSEMLAVIESPMVPTRTGIPGPPQSLHVETDYAFAVGNANDCLHSVHWVADPEFLTQVDYQRRTPCLLEVRPSIGPGVTIAPRETFDSFRTFELIFDSTDAERRGLAVRRMYRTLAPWVTENPLMMHVRFADRESVHNAIDQCAAVGFEMVILTFGSGFNIENDSPEYLDQMKAYADYARERGVEIGGYSLLASRRIDAENDVVMPEGQRPAFGNSPCLLSRWGQDYFRKLRQFYGQTGFTLLEHDGSYPGDVCASTDHPGHRSLADSRWLQWRLIAEFYQWCRSRGVYLNVPDWYYLAGSNKCGMGYRETNWSLPRAQQVIHTRQNIYDGTWQKTPSMGWMFVPLTEYHGGGAAATIEPLHKHLDHYERMLVSNLALGVQACYRGPRLYDTDETREMVTRWVAWFKEYRDILESDLIHGRRADGRRIDWMLHVNPQLAHKGMLVVFNPLDEPAADTLDVNLYYTGLNNVARLRRNGGPAVAHKLDRRYGIQVPVDLPPYGFEWIVIR